jgi:hypothetical protein
VITSACAVLTLALLLYVFWPTSESAGADRKSRAAYLLERKEAIYENLRDLSFDFKSGKFLERDYKAMRSALEEEAAAVLAELDTLRASDLEANSR